MTRSIIRLIATRMLAAIFTVVMLANCTIEQPAPPMGQSQTGQQVAPAQSQYGAPANQSTAYKLGPADETRVIVYGEKDLSGKFEVDSAGYISLPLIGQVYVANMTLRQAEQQIAYLYSQGYLNDPRVNVEVLNYRPFFILGEVQKGGQFSYQAGLTVLNAIALASGYTYRADRKYVFITHKGASGERRYSVDQQIIVQPGDVIRIPERFL